MFGRGSGTESAALYFYFDPQSDYYANFAYRYEIFSLSDRTSLKFT